MKNKRKILLMASITLIVLSLSCIVSADYRGGRHRIEPLPGVSNSTYKEVCGACHYNYPSELLPAGSWEKILSGLGNHFSEMVDIDQESKKEIIEYLKSGAADQSKSRLGMMITKSLGERTPLRITEIPYLKFRHHRMFSPDCTACHK